MAKLREDLENQAAPAAPEKVDRRRRPKIIIPLGPAGEPDLDVLDEGARERLRAALEQAAPQPAAPIDPAVVGFAIHAIASIEGAIIGPRFGLPAQEAAAACRPAPALEAQIAAAGARVLEKHSGAWSRYQDEIVLVALIVTWQTQAIQALRAAGAERRAAADEEKRESPAPARQPEPEAPRPEPIVLTDYPADL